MWFLVIGPSLTTQITILKEYQHKEEQGGQGVEIKAIWEEEAVVEAQKDDKDMIAKWGQLEKKKNIHFICAPRQCADHPGHILGLFLMEDGRRKKEEGGNKALYLRNCVWLSGWNMEKLEMALEGQDGETVANLIESRTSTPQGVVEVVVCL